MNNDVEIHMTDQPEDHTASLQAFFNVAGEAAQRYRAKGTTGIMYYSDWPNCSIYEHTKDGLIIEPIVLPAAPKLLTNE